MQSRKIGSGGGTAQGGNPYNASRDGAGGTAGNLQFCVASTLFDAAPLLLEVPSGITLPAIHRLPAHCSLRGHITPQEWQTAASTALGLSENVATRLYDAFHIISQPAGSRIELTRSVLQSRESGGTPPSRAVPLVGFMVFLMAQHFLERPPRHGPGEQSGEHVLAFVKQHLADMLLLASLGRHGKVTQQELAELRILLREFHNGSESPLGTNLQGLFASAGGSTTGANGRPSSSGGASAAVDCNVLAQFIRPRLMLPADVRGAAANVTTLKGVSQLTQFLLTAPPVRQHSSVRLLRCSQATLYGLAPLPTTVVSGLVNSVVVLGPVGGLLVIDHCDRCQIVALCAGVVVSQCRNTSVFVCTNTPPLCMPSVPPPDTKSPASPATDKFDNVGVQFAPYNSYYGTLEEHLSLAAVNPRLNLWDEGLPAHALLPPNRFAPVTVPLPPPASATEKKDAYVTRANPCPLPDAYAQAQQERAARATAVSNKLHATYKQLERGGRTDLAEGLRTKVQRAFLDWLAESGQAQSVNDLLQPAAGAGAGGGTRASMSGGRA